MERVYLDNAATSWPKPAPVYEAVRRAMEELGAPAARSTYREAADVERLVAETRRQVADFVAADDPSRIIFTFNATDSLNLAIQGTVAPGDHVVTSVVEHNSVLRPLRQLQESGGIEVTRVRCDADGIVHPDDIESAVRPNTRLIALVHASNVTGAVQPAEEVGRIAANQGALFLLDAAQTLGQWPVDVGQLGCSLLAAPAHKGLLAPLGVGILYVAPGVERRLRSIRQGGTGTKSENDRQPDTLPDKYESGNHNVPGILGLNAGMEFLRERGLASLQDHHRSLIGRLLKGLQAVESITVHGPVDRGRRIGVMSLSLAGCDPQEVAGMLDSAYHIQVRAGLHCAPLMHRALGTIAGGGTVRLSVGPFNTRAHIDLAVEAISEIVGATR